MSAILYNVKILDNICRYSTSRMTAFQANVIAKSFVGPVTTATTINVRHKSEIKMAIMQGVGGVLLFIIGITSIFVLDGHFASFAVIDAILFMSSSYLGLLKVKRRKPGVLCVTGGFGINAADIRSEQVETAFMALSSYVVMVSTITIGIIVYQYTTADYEGLQLALLMMALALSVVAVVCAGIAASCAGRHSGSCCGGRKDTSAEDERM
ncbi:uncharacterized protein TRIADDRAFT_59673 [Trichoplax adhaerens]|uniref:Uncharacterized protein n=1 Tax=Trichoplax adhaerens TaxID=10228 RepID=B3S647_TRIAD|nr:predicted protein [Trichoplax adhaerens]EDV21696.1 predicted protein [Trichoplax adhaerens]|eukprot:XP_002115844.1 predicted protein [Trichoplax adhaerens]